MKEIICFIDTNEVYVKKLNNYAIKKYGKEYIFLCFSNVKSLIEYSEENTIKCVVASSKYEKDIKFINSEIFYIQTEKKSNNKKDGDINYVYKYQKADDLLDDIDSKIKKSQMKISKQRTRTKLVVFYSPYQTKEKVEKINKLYKYLIKNKKVLILDLDEFSNFKGENGFSNIIYKYKENLLSMDSIIQEIIVENNYNIIKGVSYPEDFAVINNADLSIIISEFRDIDYDYIFINCDTSFLHNQYLFVECDKLLVFDGSKIEDNKTDVFMKYVEEQNMFDLKKIKRFTKDTNEKIPIHILSNELFGE